MTDAADLHYFPMLPADWLSGVATMQMTPEQRGAFIDLLCVSWMAKDVPCSLPNDDKVLASLSRLGRRWKTVGGTVKSQFKPVPGHPDHIRNGKLWKVYLQSVERHQKHVEAGRRGGNKAAQQRYSGASSEAGSPATERLVAEGVAPTKQSKPEPTTTSSSSARAEVESWWADEYKPDLTHFLDLVLTNETKRFGWLRNFILLRSGHPKPPPRNPESMGVGLRAMMANTDRPNWNYYVGCVDNPGNTRADAPKAGPRADDASKGDALLVLGQLRQQVVSNTTGHGTTRYIPTDVINSQPVEVREALVAAGGPRKLANVDDEKYGMMAAQFATAYSAAKQRGTRADPTRISAILPQQPTGEAA